LRVKKSIEVELWVVAKCYVDNYEYIWVRNLPDMVFLVGDLKSDDETQSIM
jgi:hypothetical protein